MITAIVPCFNAESTIRTTLESLVKSSYINEVVVVNDGSSDSSKYEIKKVKSEKIKVVDQANAGVSAARNAGLVSATNEFIVFIDADDLVDYKALDLLIGAFKTNLLDNQILIFGYKRFFSTPKYQMSFSYGKTNLLVRDFFGFLLFVNGLVNLGRVIFPKVWLKNSKFEEAFKFAEDRHFWLSVLSNNLNRKAVICEQPVLYYRVAGVGANASLRNKTEWSDFVYQEVLLPYLSNKGWAYKYLVKKVNEFRYRLESKKLSAKNNSLFFFLSFLHIYPLLAFLLMKKKMLNM